MSKQATVVCTSVFMDAPDQDLVRRITQKWVELVNALARDEAPQAPQRDDEPVPEWDAP